MIRFDNLPPEVMQAMCTPMHQILAPSPLPGHPGFNTGGLWLGSLAAVNDASTLRENHISHLVQVLDVPWLPLSEKDGFNCYKINVMDDASVDLRPHLEAVCNHIDRALRSGKSVLVHCQQVRPYFQSCPRTFLSARARMTAATSAASPCTVDMLIVVPLFELDF